MTKTVTIYITPEHLGPGADRLDAQAYSAELEDALYDFTNEDGDEIDVNVYARSGRDNIDESVEDEVRACADRVLQQGRWMRMAAEMRRG